MMATASAPSPIYPLYRERWGLSVTMLTVVFAVYVVGLLGALLTLGSLSDHLGRRPVLAVALLVAAASTAMFWKAEGVVPLVIARVVQGIAMGTATSGLAAGLVELSPERRPHLGPTMTAVGTSIGMATGAGVVGLLVQSTSRPDAYVFPVLTLTFVVSAAVILTIILRHSPRERFGSRRCDRESGFLGKRGWRSPPLFPRWSRGSPSRVCSWRSLRPW
ncbi:MFS transporter [Streptomyces glomeratus]|nr:MFS transporter [Streptomyces glomeratus]